ncbi:phosphonate ABC transporter, permease protein PhnE [Paroceanicella profunda]|uniref:Phosphonate ABC transporter, permease protein PhnE n=1 Tax=Paroceanicella profunda TaxID=2579971 RepID=A0A5B8FZ34_9RHOB|nr:phosphonate ABC transporter, permease protein PhnE [Paroceanicella profunda]QDL91862.1 phosphonate ABC transporter, permease protein PhnE [Paroceanicella profunda]
MTLDADAGQPPHRGAAGPLAALAEAYDRSELRRRSYTGILIVLVLAMLVAGFRLAEDANSGSFFGGFSHVLDYPAEILSDAWARGWSFWTIPFTVQHAENGITHTYVHYLLETVNMAVVATLTGFVIGAALSILASRNLVRNRAIVWATRRMLDIARAFPEIVIALFLIFIIGKNPIAAVAAIAFHTIGALGKLYSEVNENADMKAWEGLDAAGASWAQKVWFAILPQVMPNWVSYALLRFEINVRASAIMGFVGAGGLGQQFKTFVDWRYGADIVAIMALLIITIIAIDNLSGMLRRRLIGPGAH